MCAAGVALAFSVFGKEGEFDKYYEIFDGCMKNYLSGIGEDGCCPEGLGYWQYGFSHFVMLAQLIKVETAGEIDYFSLPKVHALACFSQKIRMDESLVAAFSDTYEACLMPLGLISFLKTMYDDVSLPEIKCGTRRGNIDSVTELLWFDENYKEEKFKAHNSYFEDMEWFISANENFSFAAKGGNNGEPHNHNDVGSFMITVKDKVFISDPGRGEYVKNTFGEFRYTFVQNSSRGHSVPIINGEYQKRNKEYCAKNVIAEKNKFSLDIENAYETGIINRISRSFVLNESSVELTDKFVFSEKTESVVDRFITKNEPEITDGVVDCKTGKIIYNSKRYIPSVQSESFVSHNGLDVITLYQIDFKGIFEKETEFSFRFIFD